MADSDPPPLRLSVDGRVLEARQGDTVAAALLRNGVTTFTRSIKYHRARGPFCFTGHCGQCLLRVDGVPSLPACRVDAVEGMRCERQNAPLGLVEADLMRATDFVFPRGLDHHHLFVQSRLLGRVALEVARRLAGLGELPSAPTLSMPGELREASVVVLGAGPAGLAAARAAGAGTLLLERDPHAGGQALLGIEPGAPDAAWVAAQVRALRAEGGELLPGAEVLAVYRNDTQRPGNAIVAARVGARALAIFAGRVIIATGGAPQPLPFPGVDRPGVYAARGLVGLHARSGLRVGDSLAVVGDGAELVHCCRALQRAGYSIARAVHVGVDPLDAADLPLVRGEPARALGNPVRALEIAGERIRCDAVALALPPAPLHELATSLGARARWSSALHGFPIEVDGDGRTCVPWLFAAGRAAGQGGAGAVESGARAGRAVRR